MLLYLLAVTISPMLLTHHMVKVFGVLALLSIRCSVLLLHDLGYLGVVPVRSDLERRGVVAFCVGQITKRGPARAAGKLT